MWLKKGEKKHEEGDVMCGLGGLGPFKFEKVLPAEAGSIKKKSRPTTGIHR